MTGNPRQSNRRGPSPREVCEEYEGHVWTAAGGGLLICARCEAEAWATGVDDGHA